MSLEQAIQENTEAINRLIDLFSSGKATMPHAEPKASAPATEAPAEKVQGPEEEPKAEPATADIPYDTVKEATLALVKAKGRDVAVEVLAKYGVKVGTELTKDQYASYVADAQAAMEV